MFMTLLHQPVVSTLDIKWSHAEEQSTQGDNIKKKIVNAVKIINSVFNNIITG